MTCIIIMILYCVCVGGTDQDMPVQVALLRPGGVADK